MTGHAQNTAWFEAGDAPTLVEASFACAYCLGRPSHVVVGVSEADGHASCYCSSCHAYTDVGLNSDQVLRLRLAPPRGVPIHIIHEE